MLPVPKYTNFQKSEKMTILCYLKQKGGEKHMRGERRIIIQLLPAGFFFTAKVLILGNGY
jgi:hypothetical protein